MQLLAGAHRRASKSQRLPSNYGSDANGLPVPDADEKRAIFPSDVEFLPTKARVSEP